jgi:hypothetical protein
MRFSLNLNEIMIPKGQIKDGLVQGNARSARFKLLLKLLSIS